MSDETLKKDVVDCESLEGVPLAKLLYYALTGGLLGGVNQQGAGIRVQGSGIRTETSPAA